MSDAPLPDEEVTLPEIRQLPAAEPRVESGPVVFGDDWPGTFIRGDHAANYAVSLRVVLDRGGECELNCVILDVLQGLLRDLESSNLVNRRG